MKTTVEGQSRLSLLNGNRSIIVDVICYFYILLFVYTATSKIITYDAFSETLGGSPLIGRYHAFIAIAIPAVEIIISLALIIPKTSRIGLWASLILMVLFTVYITYMVLFYDKLPCSCGGIISDLKWTPHIFLNLIFVAFAILGLWISAKKN